MGNYLFQLSIYMDIWWNVLCQSASCYQIRSKGQTFVSILRNIRVLVETMVLLSANHMVLAEIQSKCSILGTLTIDIDTWPMHSHPIMISKPRSLRWFHEDCCSFTRVGETSESTSKEVSLKYLIDEGYLLFNLKSWYQRKQPLAGCCESVDQLLRFRTTLYYMIPSYHYCVFAPKYLC